MGSLACLSVSKRPLAKEIHTLESKFMKLGISERCGVLASIEVKATFIEEIKTKQFEDKNLEELREKIVISISQETTLDNEGVLNFKGRICVPRVDCLIEKLLANSHDHGNQFTSKFWRKLHDDLGTQHTFSTAFHPQTDGQSERTIQVLEDMLRACLIDFGVHWDKLLPLYEFSYTNSCHSSIDMAPFEALYERGCRSPIRWFEAGDVKPLGVDLVRDTQHKITSIQAKLLAAQSRQKKYADHKVRDMAFKTGENVLLKVSPMKGVMRFGKEEQKVLEIVFIFTYETTMTLQPNYAQRHSKSSISTNHTYW
ncbi:hypothetical protein MTR67_017882 [Solanum verrucosum]|uniref:Integrase catalytic domain-containing protein n=1 Tax=Solanum verrucosum TaxID=315347 RepID=A0AAF0QKP6_SOLVR|nr:hypothetical protein MTR67_017882 [Solanum verrucosum]